MNRTIIGLAGTAGSGKDTLGDYLVCQHGFTKLAFADPLRDMVVALLVHLGIDERDALWSLANDRLFKEHPLPQIDRSPRQLMQTLGTEWGRNQVHPDLWLKIAQERIELTAGPVVITDVRFSNEAQLVRDLGGKVWQLRRLNAGLPSMHASEIPIRSAQIDRVLHNNGTPEQLFELADELLPNTGYEQP